jgi:hypothetical protein
LVEQSTALLAIKADMLGSNVDSAESLQRWLNISTDIRVGLRALAEKERVVLLIDQLDAVSELLDRRSGRLNVLLDLIQTLASTKNIHIVATSREFELRHDVRLTSLSAQDNIERVDLCLPSWEQISLALVRTGHKPDQMTDVLRELLRTPLHLKVFLDLSQPSAGFGSLQSLLGRLWEERVTDPRGPRDRIQLLQELASKMADAETLWLPVAIADRHPAARQALERAEILARGPTAQTVGFRHQTYYDYTLAQGFAEGVTSLTSHVRKRQDGLFVRPTLLSSLHFLRGNARQQYHRELEALMRARLRFHVKRLFLEFLGGQKDPDDIEAGLLLPLLKSDIDGPYVLSGAAGSPGWYERLKRHPQLKRWMRKPYQQAFHCLLLLSEAIRFNKTDVLRLLKENWLINPALDRLTLHVLRNLEDWDDEAIDVICTIARRTADWPITLLAENAAKKKPDLAPRIIRADLERRLGEALKEADKRRREAQRITSKQNRLIRSVTRPHFAPLERLIEDPKEWFNIDKFAAAAPQDFLEQLWPWFLRVIRLIAHKEHPIVVQYRDDPATSLTYDRDLSPHSLTHALWVALSKIADSDRPAFLRFVSQNERLDFMGVHQFLVRGLERIAAQEPKQALKYLLSDQRRLVIGNGFKESKRLITALCPHLSPEERQQLEERVVSIKRYKHSTRKFSIKERFQRSKWARKERLMLLRAFPDRYLSADTRRLKEEEERAFPGTPDYHIRIGEGGMVGARITAAEMSRASDADLLRLFDELHDGTEWDNPKRIWSEGVRRSGGSIQQSREFAELAKQQPDRVLRLLPQLKPGRHEKYAEAALVSFSGSSFPTEKLVPLIMDFDRRGFASPSFRDGVAGALEKCADRGQGLPDEVLGRLEEWLVVHPEPSKLPKNQQKGTADPRESPILFGMGAPSACPPEGEES